MRPRIHFTAPRGWINDPHGITARDGGYDLFHQAIPDSLVPHPGCSWGHATSPDLLRFEHRPIAVAPDADEDGIWTGALAVGDDGPRLFYTAVSLPEVGIGRIRVATPSDDAWDTWTKGDVVVTPPDDLDLVAFRDPFVLREANHWRMLVGAATTDGLALVLTWISDDLDAWRYDGVALARSTYDREPVWMGRLWECPQLLEVGDGWAMVGSVWDDDVLHHAGYALGDFAGGRFDATGWGRLTWGSYYAPSYFLDAQGRPCLIFWMRDVGDHAEGWQSCLSVPHVLGVRDGRLVASPHPNLLAACTGDIDLTGPLPVAPVLVSWLPKGDDAALTIGGGADVTTLRVAGADLIVEPAGQTMPYDGDEVMLLLDGPTLELWAGGRILSGPITPATSLSADGRATARAVEPQ